jgi:hypothetical protein
MMLCAAAISQTLVWRVSLGLCRMRGWAIAGEEGRGPGRGVYRMLTPSRTV